MAATVAAAAPSVLAIAAPITLCAGFFWLLSDPIGSSNRRIQEKIKEAERTFKKYPTTNGEEHLLNQAEWTKWDRTFAEWEAADRHRVRYYIWETLGYWKPPVAEYSEHMAMNHSWTKWKVV